MNLTPEQEHELRAKINKFFMDYSVCYTKNVIHRYVLINSHPTIGQKNEVPYVDELMEIILKE